MQTEGTTKGTTKAKKCKEEVPGIMGHEIGDSIKKTCGKIELPIKM